MTVEELEDLAKSMGYYIQKIPEKKVKLLPCTCGAKQMHVIRGGRKRMIACHRCGKKTDWFEDPFSDIHNIEKTARLAWNKMIEDGMKEVEG